MNQMMKIFPLILISFFLGMEAMANAGETPTGFLKAKDEKLKPLLTNTEKNKKTIIKTINSMIDFETLCKDSLGANWDARSETERKEFSKTLKGLIEKNLIKRLKDSKDNTITYGTETVKEDKASVSTVVRVGGNSREETEVVYKMRKQGKTWIVIDMITDGISLVSNYRDQFTSHINKKGWDDLMKTMTDKLNEKE